MLGRLFVCGLMRLGYVCVLVLFFDSWGLIWLVLVAYFTRAWVLIIPGVCVMICLFSIAVTICVELIYMAL